MIGFNKQDDDHEKIRNFLDTCSFVDTYSSEIRVGLVLLVFLSSSLLGLFGSWLARAIFAVLAGRIAMEILSFCTIDRQYDVIYKKLEYPIIVKNVNINEEDEKNNIGNKDPKIPGIDFTYEIKKETEDKFAVAFKVDDNHYRVLTWIDCPEPEKETTKKITSEILSASFEGLKKDFIYSNRCLVFNIIRVKREIEDLEIVDSHDIDNALVITECVYYPYIK